MPRCPDESISEATALAKYTGPLPVATPRCHQGSVVAEAVFEYAEWFGPSYARTR